MQIITNPGLFRLSNILLNTFGMGRRSLRTLPGSSLASCSRSAALWVLALIALTLNIGPAYGQSKKLILHDLARVNATPSFLKSNKAYIDTLPFDGIVVFSNINALQPTAISLSTMTSVFSPISGLTWNTMKSNFGSLYYGDGWPDAYDDSKWAIVTQNMANYAQTLKNAGLVGIAFDNENYGRYGNYGDPTCGIPHTMVECQNKMLARGNQVMQAMIAQFPNIVVMFFRDSYISDETFYAQPQFSQAANVAHANLLVGPFSVGFVQATQGTSARVVQGGEDVGFGAKTPTDFNYIYQYQKYGIVNDALAPNDNLSRSAGAHGYIPVALRSVWPNLVSAGVAIYDLNNLDPSNNMPTTVSTTITNALNRVDEYAWLYMEVWSSTANPLHPTMLVPPGTTADAAPQAWVDAVRSGRAAAQTAQPAALSVSSVSTSNITSSGASVTWTTNRAGNSLVEYGTTSSLGQSSFDPTQVSTHAVILSGLQAGTSYFYHVKSTDSTGMTAVSADLSFTTSPATQSGFTFLSDKQPTYSVNGWGPAEKDMSNGEQAAGDGRPLSIRGVKFAKGLGVHAGSDLRYSLGGACQTFSATVGVDDEVAGRGSVIFQVWADGLKLYDSGLLGGTSPANSVNVSVSGRNVLQLIVTDGGNGIDSDHGDWANAQISCGGTTTTSYLSDLNPTSSTNGWGPAERDMSNGEQSAGDGRTLSIRGQTFPKGLGVHAVSDVKYNLGGRCTSFSAIVGVDDEVAGNGSVVFQVWADGGLLFDSGLVTRSSPAKNVSVSISGKTELRLYVTDGGNGNAYDHADWANAKVVCN